ncbi:MAG: hypothetical protein NTY33_02465 [Candidatus Moranbacteria bacterium]|nr:hypothetical protein [Candidatus Moranbacteria bacterium]
MKTGLKKTIITFLVIINIFSLTTQTAHADLLGVALGNPMALMDTVMSAFGVNKDEIQNMMQTVNVARKKVTPPTVSITFNPTNPVPGEKVAVTAAPTYFMNSPENLYYTWYLKSAKCFAAKDLDSNGHEYGDDYKKQYASQEDFDKCDLNGDGKVDIEDYKIKAARILVNNDFVWQSADYSKDTDNDGYTAVFGGDDQRGKSEHCFIHDVASGDDHEIKCEKHLFPNAPSDKTGDGTFGASEEQFWHTNPNNNDTAGTGRTDEANVAGLGENVFSLIYSAGDKVGVAIEGVSIQPTQEKDSSYETMWAFTKNECGNKDNIGASTDNSGYPKTTGNTTTTYPNTKADHSVTPGTPPTLYSATDYLTTVTIKTVEDIAPGTSQVNDNATIRTTTTTHTVVTYVGTDPAILATNPILDEMTTSNTCSQLEAENGAVCSGTDEYKSIKMTAMATNDLNDCLYNNLITPAEGGGTKEKLDVALKYLPESPTNDSSDPPADYKTGDPKGDGDQVSLDATVANPNSASYLNYTWEVYASNEINPDDWGTAISKDKLDGATQMSGLGVSNLKFNLNFKSTDFPPANVLPKYLKVKVTAKETLAEGSGEREGHTDITIPISSSEERIRVYTAKVNADNINFPAEKTDKAGLAAQERCLFTDPKSNVKSPSAVCEVAKDEIIGVGIDDGTESDPTYTDFLWTIDGATQACPNDSFSLCIDKDGKSTDRTYFPILKEPGDQYAIELSALNKKTGERVDLTRMFKVSTPEAKIVPKEKDASDKYICRGLLLGQYLDFYGQPHDDRSDTKFQALTGNNIELYPVFSGTTAPTKFANATDCPYEWTVDGQNINAGNATTFGYSIDLNDSGKLILPPKNAGEKYVISFSDVFTPTNATKQMLNKFWNITYNQFYEKKLTHNIEIEMVDTTIAQKTNSPAKIFATVSSGIPSYFAFLFRIALAGLAIILAIKIIFFILPKREL